MAVPFVALGLKAANLATEKYHDKIYDKISPPKSSSKDALASNTFSDDSDSAQYSDHGSKDHRRKEWRRRRRGTSDGLGEREYPDQWSGYAPGYAPQAEYDASGTWGQTLYPQPYQTSSYIPPDPQQYQPTYTPPSSTSTSPDPRPPLSNRRRSYSMSSAPRRSRHKSKSTDDIDLTSGVIGALAGGLVGSQVSQGHTLPAVVAAAIGAVGANRLEKRQRRKEKEKDRAGR